MKVDEDFYNQIEDKRKDTAAKLGIKNIASTKFTRLLAKKNIIRKANIFDDEKIKKNNCRKKR